jgi:hypothetical protein
MQLDIMQAPLTELIRGAYATERVIRTASSEEIGGIVEQILMIIAKSLNVDHECAALLTRTLRNTRIGGDEFEDLFRRILSDECRGIDEDIISKLTGALFTE